MSDLSVLTFPFQQTQAPLMPNFKTKYISRHENINIILSCSTCHPPRILETAIVVSLDKPLKKNIAIAVNKEAQHDLPLSNFKKESSFSFLNRYIIHWPVPRAFQLDQRKLKLSEIK